MTRIKPLWQDRGWRAVAAAFAFNGLLFGAWAARVPAFQDRFELSPGTLGALLLALACGAIASFPFAGVLSEKKGKERFTLWCAWAYAPALVLLALSPTVYWLGISLFVFGALHGAMDVAMNGWGAQVENRLQRPVMSLFHATFSMGAGIGAASGYAAVEYHLAPERHFFLVALIGGAAALHVMIKAHTETSVAHFSDPISPVFALPSGSLVLVGFIAFCMSMGEGAMADWSAVFLRRVVEASESEAAIGYAVFSIMMVITRLCGSLIINLCGTVGTTRLSGLMAFLGLTIVATVDALPLSLIGFALTGIGYAAIMPLAFSRAANDRHMRPGPAIASVATLGYGGMLLGPPIIGYIAQLTGLRISFGILASLAIAAILLAPFMRIDRPNR